MDNPSRPTGAHQEEPATEKPCIECAQLIPISANKCSKCGCYQNWRRYIPFGESTLALVVAGAALGGTLIAGGRTLLDEVSGFFQPADFALSVAVTSINEEQAVFFLINKSDNPIVLNEFSCSIYLPIDPDEEYRKWVIGYKPPKAEKEENEWQYPTDKMVGVFLFSFAPASPILFSAGDQKVVSAKIKHISPPLATIPREGEKADAYVTSTCLGEGVDQANKMAAGFVPLRRDQLLNMDALRITSISDYSNAENENRKALIKKISDIRDERKREFDKQMENYSSRSRVDTNNTPK